MVDAIGGIRESTEKMSKIVHVVEEIAFQTRILALNAAVEAARAGEAGMGFSVVAGEVRVLAQRCADATKEIATLIDESVVKAEDGQSKVTRVSETIHAVSGATTKVRQLVDDIHSGSQEQAIGVRQVTQAVSQIEQVTQRTASAAEEAASASEQLTGLAQRLNGVVGDLAALVGAS